ncbi:MAG: YbhB/YbcL family Raf kinase inhibitor-like protein [Candidatus Omnitrophica bacterium]|nr:YbhB/YbcL family Raf kinase inhibitor-like protein [Candidatus Omnitrophota bacterium]
MALELKSPAFKSGELIPDKYTCNGADISPPLDWNEVPEETASFVIICDDPDAPGGDWVHWVVYDIPPDVNAFPEGVPKNRILNDGSKQGMTDFGNTGYGGPCPPPGAAHRYFFKLYALDCMLGSKPGLEKAELLDVIEGHILEKAELMGKFKR